MSVKKYRSIPIEVEVMRLTKENARAVLEWCGGTAAESFVPMPGRGLKAVLNIFTLGGKIQAEYGDYIIKSSEGNFYSCPSDIFAENYEEVQNG